MDRRTLILFAVMFLVIIVSQTLFKKYLPQPAQAPQQAAQPPSPNTPVQQPLETIPAATSKQATGESETVVENDLYRITFTNRGAKVKSWVLKKYDDDQGKPLDLVNKNSEKFGQPLSLWAYDEGLRNKINSALYVASSSGNQQAPTEISFEYADGDT